MDNIARHMPTYRVISILNLLSAELGGLNLTDIAARLEMPKTSLLPILRELVSFGYLTYNPDVRLYKSGDVSAANSQIKMINAVYGNASVYNSQHNHAAPASDGWWRWRPDGETGGCWKQSEGALVSGSADDWIMFPVLGINTSAAFRISVDFTASAAEGSAFAVGYYDTQELILSYAMSYSYTPGSMVWRVRKGGSDWSAPFSNGLNSADVTARLIYDGGRLYFTLQTRSGSLICLDEIRAEKEALLRRLTLVWIANNANSGVKVTGASYGNDSGINAGSDHLNGGDILFPGQSLVSADGRYRLLLEEDGNLAVYLGDAGTQSPVWQTDTAGQGASCLIMQTNQYLTLYDSNMKYIWWNSGAVNTGPVYCALGDDGILRVLAGVYPGGTAVWSSDGAAPREEPPAEISAPVNSNPYWPVGKRGAGS